MPDWNEVLGGSMTIVVGLLIWKINQRRKFTSQEVGKSIRDLGLAYACTMVLTNHIQEEGLILYMLGIASLACWRKSFYGLFTLFAFMQLAVFWFLMLP